jgi:magnesium transporter
VLSYVAVTIIAAFEPTIERLTVLAVFLPMLANLSGAAGNQAVAVSIRELSLGLVKSGDVLRVMRKEMLIGLFNGVAIGAVLGLIVLFTRDEPYFVPLVIAVAYAINSVLAVCLGGSLPLLLKATKVDPAMVSSPVLTTLTDMGAFFLTLSFAAAVLAEAGG